MNRWPVPVLMTMLWGCGTPETYLCTYEVTGTQGDEEVSEMVDYEVCSRDDLTSFSVVSMNTLMVAVDCDSVEGFEDVDDVNCSAQKCVAMETECDNLGEATPVEG